MRAGEVVREALRNVLTGTARPVLLALAVLILSAGLTIADVVAVHRIDQQALDFRSSGASVATIAAAGAIDGRQCAALAAMTGVRAAGALRRGTEVSFAATPRQTVPVFETTPGIARVLGAAAMGAGLILSADAASAVGVAAGDDLALTASTSRVAAVYDYPDDGRRRGFGYAVLEPVPANGRFDECWIDRWPSSDDAAEILQGALAPGTDAAVPMAFGQLNSTRGATLDAHALYTGRITAWGLPLAIIVSGAIGIGAMRRRRLEHAAALHLGLSHRALVAITLTEAVVWLLPTVCAAVAIAVWATTLAAPGDQWRALAAAALVPTGCVAGVLLGQAAGVLLLREAALFRYFKERA